MGKTTRPSEIALYDVYEAIRLVVEAPEHSETYAIKGIGPAELKRVMNLNYAPSHVGTCMRILRQRKILKELPHSMTTKKFYLLTGDNFRDPRIQTVPEEVMEKLINELIEDLEKIQGLLPGAIAKLLDVSKSFERFKKVKELLAGLAVIARKNL